jgi:alpha-beta hydrolase superfamily lysophospholipase
VNNVLIIQRFVDNCAQTNRRSAIVKKNDVILARQKISTRFKNADMDFMFNWAIGVSQIVGMVASQLFYALQDVKDGDPKGWRNGLVRQAGALSGQAKALLSAEQSVAAGQAYLGAAYAYRSALQFTSPKAAEFLDWACAMEKCFQEGSRLLGVPLRPIEVSFGEKTLAGYYLEHDDQPRPTIIMVGGGDTYREDLFYFAGYPSWKRGYNALMVDLPGQGLMPDRGMPFQPDMAAAVQAEIAWLESNAAVKPEQIAIYGVSGGGYITAQAVAIEPRIKAWIAATPIYDLGALMAREMGAAAAAPSWALKTVLRLVGSLNASAAINVEKYAWQFGTTDFKTVLEGVQQQAPVVDYTRINVPSLFLVSEGEGAELQRQTEAIAADFKRRSVPVTVRYFTAAEGADGHCQLNNLRLAHMVIFDWLDSLFAHDSGDVRLRV